MFQCARKHLIDRSADHIGEYDHVTTGARAKNRFNFLLKSLFFFGMRKADDRRRAQEEFDTFFHPLRQGAMRGKYYLIHICSP